jgi:hypothetical protein
MKGKKATEVGSPLGGLFDVLKWTDSMTNQLVTVAVCRLENIQFHVEVLLAAYLWVCVPGWKAPDGCWLDGSET